MSVAQIVDFKRTGRGGSSQRGMLLGEGVTQNVLLRESRPRISDHILGSSVRKNKFLPYETNKEESLKS